MLKAEAPQDRIKGPVTLENGSFSQVSPSLFFCKEFLKATEGGTKLTKALQQRDQKFGDYRTEK